MYSGVWDGLRSIVRADGVRGLYAGLIPSLLKDCPYSALYLLLYTQCKTQMARLGTTLGLRDGMRGSVRPPLPVNGIGGSLYVEGQTPLIQFSSAFLAASVATTAFQPLEVLKTRIQLSTLISTLPSHTPTNDNTVTTTTTTVSSSVASRAVQQRSQLSSASAPPSTSTLPRAVQLGRDIVREDGVKGLFKGLVPRLLRRSLSNAIAWSCYEEVTQFVTLLLVKERKMVHN